MHFEGLVNLFLFHGIKSEAVSKQLILCRLLKRECRFQDNVKEALKVKICAIGRKGGGGGGQGEEWRRAFASSAALA